MIWLAPYALVGLALLVLPAAIHLLVLRQARQIKFPGVRFVRATRAAALAIRRPSDLGLLLVRSAIIAAAALACAQPLMLSRWRLSQWNGRTSRAVVVDRRLPDAAVASRLVEAQHASAWNWLRLDAVPNADAIARATAWLAGRPPSRLELAIVSAFPEGSLDRGMFTAVPPGVGVTFIRAGTPPARRDTDLPPLDGWRQRAWLPHLSLDSRSLLVDWTETSPAAAPGWLRVHAPPDSQAAADRAVAAAHSLGAQRNAPFTVDLYLAGAVPPPHGNVQTPEVLAAVVRLRSHEAVKDLSRIQRDGPVSPSDQSAGRGGRANASNRAKESAGGPGTTGVVAAPIARGGDGQPILWAGERSHALVLVSAAPADSAMVPDLVRAIVEAVPPPLDRLALETRTIPDGELRAWRRSPAPVSRDAWPRTEYSDGRWFWGIALVLLAAEGLMRRSRPRRQEMARAA